MEMISLDLYGLPFAECFTGKEGIRASRDMRNDACLAYIQEGVQEVFASTQKLVAKNHEWILMKCGNYIANINATTEQGFKSVLFHLDPESIKIAFGNKSLDFLSRAKKMENGNTAVRMEQNQLLDSYVTSMVLYFDKPHLATEEIMSVKLQELVLILYNSGNAYVNYILSSLYVAEKLEFEKVIEANLYNNLSIPELAHLTHRSESTFKREFKKLYNTSPAKFFKDKRLQKSVELLRQGILSVSEIAWDCGFENAAHFSTSFSDKYGKSPKAYRLDLN